MLLMASTSKQMAIELRWPVRASGLVLLVPGIIFMIRTLPIRQEDDGEEDGNGHDD
jgi:hypothetical protein